MSRRTRITVFALGFLGLGVLLVLALTDLPDFGGPGHPYRDIAVPAAVAHRTANVVSSVNFDQRALDTLGEESILLGSVIGVAALLRPAKQETQEEPPDTGRSMQPVRLLGYVLLPVTLVIGFDVVAHGHLTPGGGFQGGVVLATGLHLMYVAGSYPVLQRMRPVPVFEFGEALGAIGFVAIGLTGLAVTGAFLGNFVSLGHFGQLVSGGTVALFNVVVGLEVAGSTVVLLAKFLEQYLEVTDEGEPPGPATAGAGVETGPAAEGRRS